jgi:hypothetical protein
MPFHRFILRFALDKMDICVFGASNAYGAFDREESGWVG